MLRSAAEFFSKHDEVDKAMPVLQRLLDPAFEEARPVEAWARRTLAGCLIRSPDPAVRAGAFDLIADNLKKDPGSLQDLRAGALFNSIYPGRCEETIRLFLELEQRRPLDPKEESLLVEALDRRADWEQVEARIKKLTARADCEPGMLAFHADRLIRHQRADEAVPLVSRLEAREPTMLRTSLLKARLARARGKTALAAEVLQAQAARAKDDGDRLAIAGELEASNALEAAEALLRGHLNGGKDPQRALPLAAFLVRQGRVDDALALCEPLWSGGQAATAAEICMMVLGRGRSSPAQAQTIESHLAEALAKNPADPNLVARMAALRLLQERWDEAESLYRKVVARDPRNISALNDLAWTITRRGTNLAEAMAVIERAIALAGPDAMLLDTRGVIALALRRADDAISDLKRAQSINPRPALLFHLALAYDLANNPRACSDSLREAKAMGLELGRLDSTERAALKRLEKSTH